MASVLAVAALSVGAGAFAPATAQEVPSPPVIPVGGPFNVLAGLEDENCVGRFVLRASCEIHAVDADTLQLSAYAEPLPTGNGTEVSAWVVVRAYDMATDALIQQCGPVTRTMAEPSPSGILGGLVAGAGWYCYEAGSYSPGDLADVRIEIESNSFGWSFNIATS